VVSDKTSKQPLYNILNQWSRSNKDYTQGLKYMGNNLILESTGEYTKSRIQILSIDNCKETVERTQTTAKIPSNVFGEGTDFILLNDGKTYVFQLSWKERVIIVYNYPGLEFFRKIKIPAQIREGWGFTHDPVSGKIFITDGSSKVFTCFAKNELNELLLRCDNGKYVIINGVKQNALNELEFKDG